MISGRNGELRDKLGLAAMPDHAMPQRTLAGKQRGVRRLRGDDGAEHLLRQDAVGSKLIDVGTGG